MHALALNIAGQLKQRPSLSALVLAAIATLAYPPFHLWWLGLPAVGLFVFLVHKSSSWRSAAWLGWLFGWAHLTIANNWIATAFTHQAKMPEILGWLAVPLLCLYLAVYPALAALGAKILSRNFGLLAFGAAFAATWIVAEWLRSWVFTGYPWPPIGLMLLGDWDTPGIARSLPWMGTYALSGLTVFLGVFLIWLAMGRRWLLCISYAVLLTAAMLAPSFASPTPEGGFRYTLVQPLIKQGEINDGSKFEEQFQRISRLTRSKDTTPRLVLWPESAIPDYLEDGYPQRYYSRMTAGGDPAFARERIGSLIGAGSTVLTGAINLDFEKQGVAAHPVSARNSVLALSGEGEITGHYAKAHLVPYGEYLPLEWMLEPLGLARLTAGSIPYRSGPGARTLDLGEHGRAGIQICYEIVFSGQVVDRSDRPDFIFNPSNDGWFGSWGPPQHLAQARMRAVEEGLPVLRSTTTGISAVIDASGVVSSFVPSGVADRIEGQIPLANGPTLFAQIGHGLTLGWAGFWLIAAFGLARMLALLSRRS